MIFDIFVGVFLALMLGGGMLFAGLWWFCHFMYLQFNKEVSRLINSTGEDLL